ncbi:MAG: hypothetical protein ACRD4S_00930 [Candidatus Acidiferrales bacterium]
MKNLPLIVALLWAMPALAQGYHYQNIALGPLGHPVSTATITVCAAGATGTPCSPTTPIFSDAALSLPKQNPFTSDGLGNFDFYVAPGSYVFTITGEEVSAGQSYAITVPCVPNTLAAGCGGSGSGGPNGVNDSIQTDLNGQLHGDNNFLWNPTTQILSVLGSVGVNQTAPQFNLDVAGTAAFNQFESAYVVADRMAGADMCAKIANAWLAVKSINANGGIVDARGFKGSQHCAASMWANYPVAQFNGTLLSDNVNIQSDVSQVMPAGARWTGFSGHATTTPFTNTGTSIQPSAAFPSSTPIVAMGANAGDSGIQIEGLRISCITPTGTNVAGGIGLQNQKAQENSWARNIIIDGCADTGLDWTTSQAQNSGSLENISVAEDGVSVVTATCARFGSASTSTLQLSRGVHGVTCNGGSATVEPNVGIDIEAQNLDITGVHIEEYVTGIEIGASKPVQGLLLGNVNCSSNASFPMGKCIDISAASGTTSTAIFAVDTGGANITDVLKDNMPSGCEISEAAEGTDLGSYIHGRQNIILTSAKTCAQNILNENVTGAMAPAAGGTIDANILNGVTLSGTPSAGNQCIASSSTTAAIWQPCPGGGGNVSTSSSMTNLSIPLATGAASIANSQISERTGTADDFAKSITTAGPSPWLDATNPAYGVVGDGATNDSPHMQAAANAVPTTGGTIFVPAGLNVLLNTTVTFPNPTKILCGGTVGWGNIETAESVHFETASAIELIQYGTMNGSLVHTGVTFENCSFRDISASNNTALGAIASVNADRLHCNHCNFEDFNRPPIAAPAAPTITGGGAGAVSFWAQIVCVNDASGMTAFGAEATLASSSEPLTVTAPTSTLCAAPSTGYIVLATTTGTGVEVSQPSTGNCTLNASHTGCALTSNWSATVLNSGAGTFAEVAFKYDTSAGFGILTNSRAGADLTLQDASYNDLHDISIRNSQEGLILNGGLTTLSGPGEISTNLYDFYVGYMGAGELLASGVAFETENNAGFRIGIFNSASGSEMVDNKFEGAVVPPNNITGFELNGTRQVAFYGNYWTKLNLLVQENAPNNGVFNGDNVFDFVQQVSNGSTLIAGLVTSGANEDVVIGNTSNGGIGSQIPGLSGGGAVSSVFGLTGAVLPANTTTVPETPVSLSSTTTLAPAGVPLDNVTGATYTIVCADDVRHKLFSSATAVAVTLFQANTCSAPAQPNFTLVVSVGGAGSVTITPTTSTIGKVGSAQAATLVLTTGQYAFIYTDTVSTGCTTNGCYDALVGP